MGRIFEEFQHSTAIQTKIVQHFGGFFHQRKMRKPIGRKDSTGTSRLPKNDEIGGIFVFSGSEI